MIKYFALLCLLIFSNGAFAQNALLENLAVNQQKWRLNLSTTHVDGFGDDRVEPVTFFGLSTNYSATDYTTLVFSLGMTKFYYVDFADSNEVDLSDVYIGLRHRFKNGFFKGTPLLSYGVQLPTSEFSVRNDRIATLYSGVSISWTFFRDTMIASVGGEGIYYINEYATTNTASKGSGGSLLEKTSLSSNASLTYMVGKHIGFKNSFLKSMMVVVGGSYAKLWYEEFNVAPVANTEFRYTDDNYGVGFTALASPYKNWFLSAGYGQDASAVRNGRTEYYLLDALTNTWRIGARYTQRF